MVNHRKRTNGHINLHKQHGVNPSITVCPICHKDAGVVLLGTQSKKLFGTEEAPHKIMLPDTFCDECIQIGKGHVAILPCTVNTTGLDGEAIFSILSGQKSGREKFVNPSDDTDSILWISHRIFDKLASHNPDEPRPLYVFAAPELCVKLGLVLVPSSDHPEENN